MIEILKLESDWTVWARCPEHDCRTVVHGCCEDHLLLTVRNHQREDH